MEKTIKIELTSKHLETLAILLNFGIYYAEQRLFSSDDPERREMLFSDLQGFYNLQDFIFPESRHIREMYRVQMNSGDAHEN